MASSRILWRVAAILAFAATAALAITLSHSRDASRGDPGATARSMSGPSASAPAGRPVPRPLVPQPLVVCPARASAGDQASHRTGSHC